MISLFHKIRQTLLAQSKLTRYLLYALGEILLVVIGIFLAVQVNAWNDNKKSQRIVASNTAVLIENLEADFELIESVLLKIDSERTQLNLFVERINGPKANLDTLFKITKDELRGAVSGIRFPNDDAYKTMVLSNEVNLFNNDLKKMLFSVYNWHERIDATYTREFEKYMEARKFLMEKYPSTNNLYNGPIYESVWKNVDLNDLTSRFLLVVQRKRVMYSLINSSLETLRELTSDLIKSLKTISDHAESF